MQKHTQYDEASERDYYFRAVVSVSLPLTMISCELLLCAPLCAVHRSVHSTRVVCVCFKHQYWGPTALMLAAEGGHVECVRRLLEAGADANADESVLENNSDHFFRIGRNQCFYSLCCVFRI